MVKTSFDPEVSCVVALLSPSTGIIDSHAYMLSLLADVEDNGAAPRSCRDPTKMSHSSLFLALSSLHYIQIICLPPHGYGTALYVLKSVL